MISFRYHVVSLVAIFLALALGIVVGTTALSGPITKDLRSQLNDTKQQRNDLAAQVKTLQGRVDNAGEFASTYGAQVVAGTLKGKKVLIIALPGTPSEERTGVSQQITAAGGKVSGTVTVTKNYLDPRLGDGINTLATGPSRPIGLTLPETSDSGQLGGALLAYVLLGKGEKTDLTQVLASLSAQHMITVDARTITPSTLIIVLGHGTMSSKSYGSLAEVALVAALVKAGAHVVVAGDAASASGGGLVAAVRDRPAERSASATVDNADSAFGQVSTVLALAAAAKGQNGHYGTENGADALFPTPTR